MSRETVNLKKLIFELLSGDATLETLLGGADKIRHSNPLQVSEYPCVVYSIADEDEPYKPDVPTGIAKTIILIETFTNKTSSQVLDNIDDRIYTLLNGQRISNPDILVYTTYRTARTGLFEPDIEAWHSVNTFEAVNVPKP